MEPMVVYLYAPHLLADLQQAVEPALRGCPVAIVEGSRLLDVSWEAAARGVDAGTPLHQARLACPTLQVRPYREEEVRQALTGLWDALLPESTAVEPDGLQGVFVEACAPAANASPVADASAALLGRRLLDRARRALAVRMVAGVGPNKLVAKAAALLQAQAGLPAHGAMPAPGPQVTGPALADSEAAVAPGVRVALPVSDFMASLPLALLWPLPEKLRQQLALLGFRTAGELTGMGPEPLLRRFGPRGWHLWALSRGIDGTPVLPAYPPPAVARSLDLESADGVLIEQGAALEEQVRRWAMEMARQLEASGQRAGRLGLSLTLRPRSCPTGRELAVARTASPGEGRHHPRSLAELAGRLFRRTLEQAAPWLEAGAQPSRLSLAALEIRPAAYRQAALLTGTAEHRWLRIRRALEAVRRQVGPGRIRTAAEMSLPWREARLALVEQGAWLP